jgi:NAD(P)-dependent dehydrogenase (short-subunit alcohol dehydrogenase family)
VTFNNAHIVVTGASTGIGRATAETLAKGGAKVTLIARRADKLAQAVAQIGSNAAFAVADVSDKAQLLSALESAEAQHGPIDGLFANAGIGGSFAPVLNYDDDVWDTVMATNVKAVLWAIQRVLPGMIARKHGAILVTGSLASERGMANNVGYVASKHAVLGLARAVALETAPHGVRCNCIVPGLIDTPMLDTLPDDAKATLSTHIPQQRLGGGDELASVAAFLLSDAARHVTGQSWAVDGGILGTLKFD